MSLLNIHPDQPFLDWLAYHDIPNSNWLDTPANDKISLLLKYAFNLNPNLPATSSDIQILTSNDPSGLPTLTFQPTPERTRHVSIKAKFSENLNSWTPVPPAWLTIDPDGIHLITLPDDQFDRAFFRLKATINPVN